MCMNEAKHKNNNLHGGRAVQGILEALGHCKLSLSLYDSYKFFDPRILTCESGRKLVLLRQVYGMDNILNRACKNRDLIPEKGQGPYIIARILPCQMPCMSDNRMTPRPTPPHPRITYFL